MVGKGKAKKSKRFPPLDGPKGQLTLMAHLNMDSSARAPKELTETDNVENLVEDQMATVPVTASVPETLSAVAVKDPPASKDPAASFWPDKVPENSDNTLDTESSDKKDTDTQITETIHEGKDEAPQVADVTQIADGASESGDGADDRMSPDDAITENETNAKVAPAINHDLGDYLSAGNQTMDEDGPFTPGGKNFSPIEPTLTRGMTATVESEDMKADRSGELLKTSQDVEGSAPVGNMGVEETSADEEAKTIEQVLPPVHVEASEPAEDRSNWNNGNTPPAPQDPREGHESMDSILAEADAAPEAAGKADEQAMEEQPSSDATTTESRIPKTGPDDATDSSADTTVVQYPTPEDEDSPDGVKPLLPPCPTPPVQELPPSVIMHRKTGGLHETSEKKKTGKTKGEKLPEKNTVDLTLPEALSADIRPAVDSTAEPAADSAIDSSTTDNSTNNTENAAAPPGSWPNVPEDIDNVSQDAGSSKPSEEAPSNEQTDLLTLTNHPSETPTDDARATVEDFPNDEALSPPQEEAKADPATDLSTENTEVPQVPVVDALVAEEPSNGSEDPGTTDTKHEVPAELTAEAPAETPVEAPADAPTTSSDALTEVSGVFTNAPANSTDPPDPPIGSSDDTTQPSDVPVELPSASEKTSGAAGENDEIDTPEKGPAEAPQEAPGNSSTKVITDSSLEALTDVQEVKDIGGDEPVETPAEPSTEPPPPVIAEVPIDSSAEGIIEPISDTAVENKIAVPEAQEHTRADVAVEAPVEAPAEDTPVAAAPSEEGAVPHDEAAREPAAEEPVAASVEPAAEGLGIVVPDEAEAIASEEAVIVEEPADPTPVSAPPSPRSEKKGWTRQLRRASRGSKTDEPPSPRPTRKRRESETNILTKWITGSVPSSLPRESTQRRSKRADTDASKSTKSTDRPSSSRDNKAAEGKETRRRHKEKEADAAAVTVTVLTAAAEASAKAAETSAVVSVDGDIPRPPKPPRRRTTSDRGGTFAKDTPLKPIRPALFGMGKVIGQSDAKVPLFINTNNKDLRPERPSSSRHSSSNHHRSAEEKAASRARREERRLGEGGNSPEESRQARHARRREEEERARRPPPSPPALDDVSKGYSSGRMRDKGKERERDRDRERLRSPRYSSERDQAPAVKMGKAAANVFMKIFA